MPASPISEVLQHLRSTLLVRQGADLADGQLLERFVTCREPAALESLVRRHGPMVWGVCQRVLGNAHDAEDAFQATFLILVRKAAAVRPPAKVGNWLYGVAHQTAIKARATRMKRQIREKSMTEISEPAVGEQNLWTDLLPLLDQEVSRLPEKYRTVIVLCELEGKSGKETARQLGLPAGTVASRLSRARTMLAKRLAPHGLAVTGLSLGALLSPNVAVAGVPASVLSSTIKAATLLAAGETTAACLISAKAAALTQGVIKAMLLSKLKNGVAIMLAVLFLAGLGTWLGLLSAGRAAPLRTKVNPDNVPGKIDPADQAAAQGAQNKPEILTFTGHKESVMSVCFSPDGQRLASASADKTVKVWDSRTGQEFLILKGHTDGIHCVCFGPDGQRLATSCHDGSVKVWDAKTGQDLLTFKGHKSAATSVCFSPDGKQLASVESLGTAKLWCPKSGKEFLTLTDNVTSAAFSPEGDRLVTGGGFFDKTVKVWDVKTGKKCLTLQGHTNYVRSVSYSSDGLRLASGSFDKTIKVWDAKTGKELLTLKGHDADQIRNVCFSPDGQRLASAGGFDRMVKVWDVKSGQELLTFNGHLSHVGSVCFSSDGQRLASASFDKTVRVWNVQTMPNRQQK